MGTKSHSRKRLKNELAAVGKEIDERIVKLEKMPTAGKQGYIEMKKIIANQQVLAEAEFRKSLMSSGDEVWNFAWENVWEALKEFQSKATAETKQNYEGLESCLRAKQSYLQAALKVPEMFVDQVWTEVWTAVWNVVWGVNDEYKRRVTAELVQADKELQSLLAKQLVLQTELEELLKSGN